MTQAGPHHMPTRSEQTPHKQQTPQPGSASAHANKAARLPWGCVTITGDHHRSPGKLSTERLGGTVSQAARAFSQRRTDGRPDSGSHSIGSPGAQPAEACRLGTRPGVSPGERIEMSRGPGGKPRPGWDPHQHTEEWQRPARRRSSRRVPEKHLGLQRAWSPELQREVGEPVAQPWGWGSPHTGPRPVPPEGCGPTGRKQGAPEAGTAGTVPLSSLRSPSQPPSRPWPQPPLRRHSPLPRDEAKQVVAQLTIHRPHHQWLGPRSCPPTHTQTYTHRDMHVTSTCREGGHNSGN